MRKYGFIVGIALLFLVIFMTIVNSQAIITTSIPKTPEAFPHPPKDALIPPDYYLESITTGLGGGPGPTETSDFLIRDVSIAIVLLESDGSIDPSTEDWTPQMINDVHAQVQEGLEWYIDKQLSAKITYKYHTHLINTGYEPISRSSLDERLWITEVLQHFNINSGNYFNDMRQFDDDMRTNDGTDWGITIFVVNSLNDFDGRFADYAFAYAYLRGPFIVMTYDNGGWGINRMKDLTAHELGHSFDAPDQYQGSWMCRQPTDCSTNWGYHLAENQNCMVAACFSNVDSIMRNTPAAYANDAIDPYAKLHMGWQFANNDAVLDAIQNPYNPGVDTDNDSLVDYWDNCPFNANIDQVDDDGIESIKGLFDVSNPTESFGPPFVMKENNVYKAWYTTSNSNQVQNRTGWALYYATSADGMTWTNPTKIFGGQAGAWGYQYRPFIMKEGSTYKMWYTFLHNGATGIYYRTSTDGITWTQQTQTQGITGNNMQLPNVFQEGNQYVMFYTAVNGANKWSVWRATSADGITWTNTQQVITNIKDNPNKINGLFVVPMNEDPFKYVAVYEDASDNIVYARTQDGITWTRSVPLVQQTIRETFGATILNDNGQHFLYTGERPNGERVRINIDKETSVFVEEGDRHGNVCDNCPNTYNPGQRDNDNDGFGNACEIQCTPQNNAPDFRDFKKEVEATMNQTLQITFQAVDNDNNPIRFTTTSAFGQLDPYTGEFSWTPTTFGIVDIPITVSDSCSTTTKTMSVFVGDGTRWPTRPQPICNGC